jgi:RNA recognition motif
MNAFAVRGFGLPQGNPLPGPLPSAVHGTAFLNQPMNQSASSQPRRRSRGGRNRHHSGGSREHYNQDNHTFKRPAPPAKKSLLERLLGLFGLGAQKPVRPEGEARKPSGRGQALASSRKPAESRPREARPPRVPRPVIQHEVTSGRLYVGNLSYDAAESDLLSLFGGIGHVRSAEVVCHRHNQRSKGYAFVEMLSIEDARRAVRELHDKEFMGRKMLVSGARASTANTGGERGSDGPQEQAPDDGADAPDEPRSPSTNT